MIFLFLRTGGIVEESISLVKGFVVRIAIFLKKLTYDNMRFKKELVFCHCKIQIVLMTLHLVIHLGAAITNKIQLPHTLFLSL